MADIAKSRVVRFGPILTTEIGVRPVATTFKFWKQGDECYVLPRNSKINMKISLHSSGITRFADNSANPRKPEQRETMGPVKGHEFTTVFRAIYVPVREVSPLTEGAKNLVGISPFDHAGRPYVSFQIGFILRERAPLRTKIDDVNAHLARLDLVNQGTEASAILTASAWSFAEISDLLSQRQVLDSSQLSFERHALQSPGDNFRHELVLNYHSQANTYTYLIFYGIPDESRNIWYESRPEFDLIDPSGAVRQLLREQAPVPNFRSGISASF